MSVKCVLQEAPIEKIMWQRVDKVKSAIWKLLWTGECDNWYKEAPIHIIMWNGLKSSYGMEAATSGFT
jgi:hypothetical protein